MSEEKECVVQAKDAPGNDSAAVAATASPPAGADAAGGVALRPIGAGEDPAGRLQSLELSLAEQTQKNDGLGKSLKEVEGQLEKTRGELGQATEQYRKLVFTLHPAIPAELIGGASVLEIDASLEKAKALVEKIRESLVKQGRGVIPAGAPVRSAPDYSGLSPRDKIKAGIGQRQR